MGVASLASEQFTSFTVPADVALGAYLLEVVANGIASEAVTVAITSRAAVPSMSEAYSFARGKRDTARDLAVQEEMFWRDLNEVHLLMDFISGRPDTSLLDLKDIPDPTPGANAVLPPQEVLHRVCLIRFPPVGSPDDKADQAALLLMVKDRLNALANPAKGLTIAFTTMFTSQYGKGYRKGRDRMAPSALAWQRGVGFAVEAYPNLYRRAIWFRRGFTALPPLTFLLLLATAFTAWDVVLASQTLREADAEVLALPNSAVNDTSCFITRNGSAGTLDPTKVPPAIAVSCQTLVGIENTGTVQPNPSYAARISSADMLLGSISWWHPVGLTVRLFERPLPSWTAENKVVQTPPKDSNPQDPEFLCGGEGTCDRVADVTSLGESVINVFSNNVLPIMFGLLGNFSGLMRLINNKVRDSTLSPRDIRLLVSLMPMGVVAGLTVGLIFSPNAGSSISGTVGTLSASALAFLAGYGVDFYFNALDSILARVFPKSTTENGNSK
jgi:hypothetical protein